jgi:4-alpha-glucanotransferase
MEFPRASGVLLHPTALPGPYGVGDLGAAAYRFVDFLSAADQTYWQVLPLGPTGFGDSPYQCFSSFAGNPLLISPELLLQDGLLERDDLGEAPPFSPDSVIFGWVIPWKLRLLDRAFQRFQSDKSASLHGDFNAYCQQSAVWLDDFALFMALKEVHSGAIWSDWPSPLARRDPQALAEARRANQEAILRHQFLQWLFSQQWGRLRGYAARAGIRFIGDVPIFVAYDSADVWANPHYFFLNESLRPLVVAGVPPDYFSPTGQLWGNPLYRWDAMAASSFAWWVKRVKVALNAVDVLRIDHFRGLQAYWEIPADALTAEHGRWVRGPGAGLFAAIKQALGGLPIIAEDLGVITPEVDALRDEFGLPGMKVLAFAFGSGPSNPHLPHHHRPNTVVYTGTHDNDTLLGFFARPEAAADLAYACQYVGTDGNDIVWDIIRAAWASVAHTAIAPLQDLLGLGTDARFNFPSKASGNWSWRYRDGVLTDYLAQRLARLTAIYGRSRGAGQASPPTEAPISSHGD